ncbi:elongation factor P hydroxylase [Bermanella marisrubri]|uniref:Transporting ATPase n=1 Tax=Bermanella marisrubri TaxID=207949 RepID=Q1N6E1_9GAMM|nr:elongation factor P hydroxylase [Bermanella marisrubri]EAT13651.1 hypothetical protein RED65_09674 [Oceanobacter sp. RED65] [Bermanella marisrubri]QIZ84436.1 elongation factor P hydroxylase [Bermanella marisrubri]
MHKCQDIIDVFNACFKIDLATELVKGGEEPIYLPATPYYPYHRVIFARGFYASALHEISHWCIAGQARRQLVDFGYWYNPDGRTQDEQDEFEKVEIKPQALEWILAKSAGFHFNVSLDNLNGDLGDIEDRTQRFKRALHEQVKDYLKNGLPKRAQQFSQALIKFYKRPPLAVDEFTLEAL